MKRHEEGNSQVYLENYNCYVYLEQILTLLCQEIKLQDQPLARWVWALSIKPGSLHHLYKYEEQLIGFLHDTWKSMK